MARAERDEDTEKGEKLIQQSRPCSLCSGPALLRGASNDDPSGIATYSQVDAQFGLGTTWTMLFSYPLMAAI